MKLSQKKNCTGCKALTTNQFSAECALGCKPKASNHSFGIPIEYKPDRPCYKPMSNIKLIEISKENRNENNRI
jgi:hypothetical protein